MPTMELGRGVRGTAVWFEAVDSEEEEEDIEEAGEGGLGEEDNRVLRVGTGLGDAGRREASA